MKKAADVTLSGSELSQPNGGQTKDWLTAIVPGTVLNSLIYNKVYPEPYYGMNNKIDRGLIPDLNRAGSDFYTYWWRTEFDVPADFAGKTVWLDVEGINYRADIYLNGERLGGLYGMFQPKVIDITRLARIGQKNVLALLVRPIDFPGSPSGNKDYGASGENHNGGDGIIGKNVTMLMSAGWDFTFYDGIRDRNTGIWKSISLFATDGVRLSYPFVKSDLTDNYTRSSETVSVEVTNPSAETQTFTIEGTIEGTGISFAKRFTIEGTTTKEVTFSPKEFPQLTIGHPRLWWPIYKGEQHLYTLRLAAKVNGIVGDSLTTRFGIREIRSDQLTPDKSRQFYVNGRKFFVRGTNWIPEGMLRCSDERTYAELRYTRQTGINFIRLWGGGIAESDYFYQLCDEMGFIVWQEFWLTADTNGKNGLPQVTDNDLYMQNVTATVKRLRNHASIGYWVAANEGTDIPGTRELIDKLDGTRGYQRQSEVDGVHDGSPYKQVNPMRHYTNDASERGSRIDGFNPEYGAPAMPLVESLREFMPEELLWPVGTETWKKAWDYHDGNGFHLMSSLYRELTDAYGPSQSLEEFARKGQLVAAMNGKTIWEPWNEQKLDYGDRYASGLLFWYHNCPVDQVCARFYDHSLEPTAMLYHTANALQPLHPQFDYKTSTVSVVNDYYTAYDGLTLTAEVYDLRSRKLWSKSQQVSLPADGVANDVFTVVFPEGITQVHFLKLRLTDKAGHLVGDNFYWRSLDRDNGERYHASGPCAAGFQSLADMPQAKVTITALGGFPSEPLQVEVKNTGKTIAFFLQLQLKDEENRSVKPCFMTDNFFSLLPGEKKTVTVDTLGGFPTKTITLVLKGWNIAEKQVRLKSPQHPRPLSLVPTTSSTAPDYYCTWNLQGYVCSYGAGAGSNDLRIEINEDNLFGSRLGYKVWGCEQPKTTLTSGNPPKEVTWTVPARYQGWLSHFPMLHGDLTFVMDDSWDIPCGPGPDGASKRPGGRNYDNEYLATTAIDSTRFPSFRGDDQQRMKQLVKAVKEQGWRSLGGWVCAQDPIGLTREYTGMENTYENALRWTPEQEERFWKRRLGESQRAGFSYWKVDWGNKDRDEQFRRRLSLWGREVAPDVVIEHASFQDGGTHHPGFISFSQTIRSYDVNNQIAQAQTLQRLYDLGQQPDAELEGWGIINCEDEAYIAAGLGCAIGVMRHPYVGALPSGQPDTYFADCGPGSRQLKNRLNEIVRAVRWHRIAQPFGHQRSQWHADSETLEENGNGKKWVAPARMSRCLPLPEITGKEATAPNRPYVLASLYENECTSVAIINRNINGIYQQQRVDVMAQPLRWDRKVGIFGYCRTLILRYQGGLPAGPFCVYAQDLASDETPTAIPYTITSDGRGIIIQGTDLEALCMGHDYPYSEVQREVDKDYTDQSDPAVVILIVDSSTNQKSPA